MARPSSASIISCALLTAATPNCSPTMWRRATCQRRAPGAAGTNTGCWPRRSGVKSVRMSIGKWRPTSGSRTGFLNRPYAPFRTRPLLINQDAWIQARLMSAMLTVAAPKRTSRRGRPNATRRFDWQKPHLRLAKASSRRSRSNARRLGRASVRRGSPLVNCLGSGAVRRCRPDATGPPLCAGMLRQEFVPLEELLDHVRKDTPGQGAAAEWNAGNIPATDSGEMGNDLTGFVNAEDKPWVPFVGDTPGGLNGQYARPQQFGCSVQMREFVGRPALPVGPHVGKDSYRASHW